ncbi:unnamed protein product [Didymodactylos carnosus]|uniref:Uncharacterized protein n=1 Tax=Didymodactylos carnosus TaxID=1234261 RepID=A0A814R1S4_9BILA|nr:unnamed protein product [Didymodactylos carnosus]CAF1127380.1 unnamed protein product [Didymodactylos carnosus]CAF3757268.1 unnamed protein product [Didymodactylos carnosus]CAF3890829.1 unnamed protein product [Didymodactylos carnosus]
MTPMTKYEDLCNEIHMEIYEFLDFYSVFKSFWNINERFNQILTDKRLRLTQTTKYIPAQFFHSYFEQNLSIIGNHLVSLKFQSDENQQNIKLLLLLSICNFSQFHRLESLIIIGGIYSIENLTRLILELKNVSKLTTLYINQIRLVGIYHDNIIKMILFENYLPQLRKFMFLNAFVPSYDSSSQSCHNIENLTISCSKDVLSWLFIHSPKLIYLNLRLYPPFEVHHLSSVEALSLPMVLLLKHLKICIFEVLCCDISIVLKSMPNLKILEINGDASHLALLDGRMIMSLVPTLLKYTIELEMPSPVINVSIDWILETYNWHNVQCSICGCSILLSAKKK